MLTNWNLNGWIDIFDRSNPNDIVLFVPANNPNYPDMPNGGNITRYQEMERSFSKHNCWFGRRDLLRVYLVVKVDKEEITLFDYWIHGKQDGSIDWPNEQVESLVPKAIQNKVKEQIAKIIELSKGDYPLMIHLLKK